MNPFQPDSMVKNHFFGKNLLGFIDEKKKKPWSYGVMREKAIAKRRKHNKMAAASRRINRIRQELDKGTKRECKKQKSKQEKMAWHR